MTSTFSFVIVRAPFLNIAAATQHITSLRAEHRVNWSEEINGTLCFCVVMQSALDEGTRRRQRWHCKRSHSTTTFKTSTISFFLSPLAWTFYYSVNDRAPQAGAHIPGVCSCLNLNTMWTLWNWISKVGWRDETCFQVEKRSASCDEYLNSRRWRTRRFAVMST